MAEPTKYCLGVKLKILGEELWCK